MKKFIISLVLFITLVGSVVAIENNRKENLFSTFYSYVDDLNENYKKSAEAISYARQTYISVLHNQKVQLLLEGKPTDVIDAKLKDLVELEKESAPIQIKIKSVEYNSDFEWNKQEIIMSRKLNNVYEFTIILNDKYLGPSLVDVCRELYDCFDNNSYSGEEEIPGIPNRVLGECYELTDIAANYFFYVLTIEEYELIMQYCIDKVGLEVYNLILEDLK